MKKSYIFKIWIILSFCVLMSSAGGYAQSLSAFTSSNQSVCYNDGSLIVHARGGTPPYTDSILAGPASISITYPIAIRPGDSTFLNLPHGFFTVVVHDAAGHQAQVNGTVAGSYQFPRFYFYQSRYQINGSHYADTVYCQIAAGSGTAPFQYAISSTNAVSGFSAYSSDSFFTHLCPGHYWVKVLDACGNVFTDNYNYSYDIQAYPLCQNSTQGTLDMSHLYGTPPFTYTYRNSSPSYTRSNTTGSFTGLGRGFNGKVIVSDGCGVTDSIAVVNESITLMETCPFDSVIYWQNFHGVTKPDTLHIVCTDCSPVQAYTFTQNDTFPDKLFTRILPNRTYHIVAYSRACGGRDTIPVSVSTPRASVRPLTVVNISCKSFTAHYEGVTGWMKFDSFELKTYAGTTVSMIRRRDSVVSFYRLPAGDYVLNAYNNDLCHAYKGYFSNPGFSYLAQITTDNSCHKSYELLIDQTKTRFYQDFSLVRGAHDTLRSDPGFSAHYARISHLQPGTYTLMSDSGCSKSITLSAMPVYSGSFSSYMSCAGEPMIGYNISTAGFVNNDILIKLYKNSNLIASVPPYAPPFNNYPVHDTGWFHYEVYALPTHHADSTAGSTSYDSVCPLDSGMIFVSSSRVPYPRVSNIYECGRGRLPRYTILGGSIPYVVQIPGVDTVTLTGNVGSFPTDSPGSYTLIVYDNCGISRSYSFSIMDTCPGVINPPDTTPIIDTTPVVIDTCPHLILDATYGHICFGAADMLRASINIPDTGAHFVWDPRAYAPSIIVSPDSDMTYGVTYITGKEGCASETRFVHISVSAPVTMSAAGDTSFCEGNRTMLRTYASMAGGQFQWQPGDQNTPIVMVAPQNTTVYKVSYSVPGCLTVYDSVRVGVSHPPSISLQPVVSCYGMHTGAIVPDIQPQGRYDYAWSDGNTDAIDSNLAPGSYTLTVSVGGQCSATATAMVTETDTVALVAEANGRSVKEGNQIQLMSAIKGCSDSLISSYVWNSNSWLNCTGCPAPVLQAAAGDTAGTFSLTVTYGANNCKVTSSGSITIIAIPGLVLPSAFSPNGDGVNDIYTAEGKGIVTFHMTIYSRWGEQVYSGDDLHSGWDGMVKGAPGVAEAYQVYVDAQMNDGSSMHKEQAIMLMR